MKISVLVPVYGVEKYIARCAESLFGQTYQDLEFVFVDDCTPDRSIAILQEVMARWPQRAEQVRILRNDRNRGIGYVRQRLIDECTGDCITFVDSDDYLPSRAIGLLAAEMERSGADMVDGAWQSVTPQGVSAVRRPYKTPDGGRYLALLLCQNVVSNRMWGRLYRRSLFTENGIRLVPGIDFSEDYSGQFFFREVGGAGRITCVCNDATLRVLGTEDDIAYLARVSNPGGSPLAVWYNGLTGHTCLLRYQSAKYLVTVYDDLLTPILGDDGAALEVDVTDVCASAKIPTTPQYNAIGRKHVQGHAWLYATTTAGAALLVSTEDDGLAIAHEATLQEDPDNHGKILVERDDDGNMVRDDDLSCIMRPITTEGPEIRFNVKVEGERNYVANAWRAMPHFQRKQISLNYSNSNECHLLTDAIDTWLVLTDGRLIRMDQYGFPPYTTWRTEAPGLNAIVTGRQDCLVSTGVVTLMACGRGTETWAYMPAFALLASDARYAGADGLTQNLALKTDAVRGFGHTDGLLPFWPRFGHAPYFCANPLRSPYALIGAPTWLVSHSTVADRIL